VCWMSKHIKKNLKKGLVFNMNYQQASALLTGRCKNQRKLANNTYLQLRENGKLVVKLWNTDIIIFQPNGEIKLDSGGFKTMLTKNRMNEYVNGLGLYSDKGRWKVDNSFFYDGMVVKEGKALLPQEAYPDSLVQLEKSIKKYCQGIQALDVIPVPNGGDCWICSMFDAQPPSTPSNKMNPRTKKARDTQHLKSHLVENYVHGALIVNAMRYAGYSDESIGLYYSMANPKGDRDGFGRKTIVNSVRRYLKNQFGLPA